ncbi:MAG: hypothetical protein ACR2PL_27765 [Dehalococcoidia bacterium]
MRVLSPAAVYPAILAILQAMAIVPHPNGQSPLAQLLSALLVGGSVRSSVLKRMLGSDLTVSVAERYRRVARAWTRPWLTSAWLTPRLLRAALALGESEGELVLALDSVRCGKWEIFTVGLVWHKRALLVGWSVLPYPWPKKRFTPVVCALLESAAEAWPAPQPAPHLVADRGFPSARLFGLLHRLGWKDTIRLRAKDGVTLAGVHQTVRARFGLQAEGQWVGQQARYGGKRGVEATLVTGKGLPGLAWHQRDDGSARARQQRQKRRRCSILSSASAARCQVLPSERLLSMTNDS